MVVARRSRDESPHTLTDTTPHGTRVARTLRLFLFGYPVKMAGDAHVDVTTRGGELVVSLAGDVAFPFAAAVQNAWEARRDGRRRLVVDLGRVTFMDSTGITALIECRQQAHAVDMRFAVRNASPTLTQKLQLLGLDWLLARE